MHEQKTESADQLSCDPATLRRSLDELRLYSTDEDAKAVFDRFRRAIAVRHRLSVLHAQERWYKG